MDFDTKSAVAQIYRPIIRGYFGVAAVYYGIMTSLNLATLDGFEQALMAGASFVATIVIIAALVIVRQPLAIGKLEALVSVVNLMLLGNVLVAMHVGYAPAKLIYFVMMAMIFAFACVSMRQAIVSIAAVLGGLFYELVRHNPEQTGLYGYIAFAAAMSALAITFFLRRSIGLAVIERHKAENKLHETQSLSETMRQRSLSDSLTGLPNRRAFFEAFDGVRESASLAPNSIQNAWLVLLDLDGFKAVNDVYGHIMGDELLKSVSKRMSIYCDTEAHVSRMGGDEFNIVLHSNADDDRVEAWCQRLLEKIAEVYQIDDRLIQISGSIGCHKITTDQTDTEIIRNADYALLHAKKHGKNRVVVFMEQHAKGAAESYKIEQALRVANLDAEIELLFQPQVDLGTNVIVRAEALARWDSPILGQISPDLFIKIAEESGLIANITLSVIGKAIAAIKSWEDPVPISINLSGHDLISDLIVDQIIALLKESGLDPALIEFEVTESAMMTDTQKAGANMLRLSELGHPMALDDFGTGYSNFSYLRTLPINKLKVDRSFMENLGDPMTEKILQSLAGMARTLDVHCLLEGIEDELGLVMAKRVGAQSVQGYHFGMPMSAIELFTNLETQNTANESDKLRKAAG